MLDQKLDDTISLPMLGAEHASALLALCQAEAYQLRTWLPWVDEIDSLEASRFYIQQALLQFAQQRTLLLAVMVEGQLAGLAGYNGVCRRLGRGRIGYWLATPYRGRGIMTTVVSNLISQGLGEMGLHRLEIHTHKDNQPSRALCERLGLILQSSREPGLVSYRADAGIWQPPVSAR